MPLRKPPAFFDSHSPSLPWCTGLNFRDQRELMERPFFSLSKTPRFEAISYHFGDVSIDVQSGQDRGLATIWDPIFSFGPPLKSCH